MNGLLAIIAKNNFQINNPKIEWKNRFGFQKPFLHRKISNQNFLVELVTLDQFNEEKVWIDCDDYFVATDGLILNIELLIKKYRFESLKQLFDFYYLSTSAFFSEFEGNFTGILYNKKNNDFQVFNNKTAQKKLFYFDNKDFSIFCSDLKVITSYLRSSNINFSLNIDAAYLLLNSGFMHENLTLITEIEQLRAGEYAKSENDKLSIQSYFHLRDIETTKDNKKEIIENLDFLFRKAVELEFSIDSKYAYNHLTTISGGLDSRMTALVAYKSGFKNQHLINFSQAGYADQVIADQISTAYNMPLKKVDLQPDSLTTIDENILVNDGQTVYTACSHVFSILSNIDIANTGIVHTGILGDAILGSYLSSNKIEKPKLTQGMYSGKLISKSEVFLKNNLRNYPNEELYKLYNRAFNGINNGCLYLDQLGETSSPFLNSEFLQYAYSIPVEFKYKEQIYIDWIKTLHPEFAAFIWENIGGKPTNNKLVRLGYRINRAMIKRLPIQSMWKATMTPEQEWYNKNINVKMTLDKYFNDHIHLCDNTPELRADLIYLYNSGNITEKSQALTLLSAIKLHF